MKNTRYLLRIFLYSAIVSAFSVILNATSATANEELNLAQKAFVTTSSISAWESMKHIDLFYRAIMVFD